MTERSGTFAYKVIARDHKCQECGSTDRLQAHHIIPLSLGGRDRPDNGIALCAHCHAQRHPDVPLGLFLIRVSGSLVEARWNATSLAAHICCHPRTIQRHALEMGIERQGATWAFTDEQAHALILAIRPQESLDLIPRSFTIAVGQDIRLAQEARERGDQLGRLVSVSEVLRDILDKYTAERQRFEDALLESSGIKVVRGDGRE